MICFQDNPHEHKLKCFYTTNGNNPLLMLAPAKVEQLYHSPDLVQFHDVVSDNEIELIKNLSTPIVSITSRMFIVRYDLLNKSVC